MGRVCHRNGRLCQRGVTTFMEMPLNQIPATVDKTSLEIKYKAGENKLKVDVGSFMAWSRPTWLAGFRNLMKEAFPAINAFRNVRRSFN